MIVFRRKKSIYKLLQLNPYDEDDRATYNNEAVREAIQRNPGAATAKYRFKEMFQNLYPLSVAVALGASLDVVELIYNAHPEAIEETGYVERTALHWACRFKAPLEVVIFLIDKYPAALRKKTTQGMTPLHHACSDNASVGVIRVLVERHPAAVEQKEIHGNTPHMLAKRFNAPPEVLELLRDAHHSRSRDTSSTPGKQSRRHSHFASVERLQVSRSDVFRRQYSADMRWQTASLESQMITAIKTEQERFYGKTKTEEQRAANSDKRHVLSKNPRRNTVDRKQ